MDLWHTYTAQSPQFQHFKNLYTALPELVLGHCTCKQKIIASFEVFAAV
jgi:hypothetical protein